LKPYLLPCSHVYTISLLEFKNVLYCELIQLYKLLVNLLYNLVVLVSYRYGSPRKTDHLVVPIDPETKDAIKTYCFEILEFEKFSECVRYMLKNTSNGLES
jgi:hypothetical protein